jgi:hypothetical protein
MSSRGNSAAELEYFEPARLEIAQAISAKIGIPMSEFEGGSDDTAFFHWITSLLAVEKWLRATAYDETAMDEGLVGYRIARNKLAASALLRLFHHRFNLDLDDKAMQFLNAFGSIARTDAGALEALLNGWHFMRQIAGGIAAYWWQSQSIPMITEGHFADLDEAIDDADERFEFLKHAYRDAIMQMAVEFQYLKQAQGEGKLGVEFPDEMPGEVDDLGIIAGMKQYLSQAASALRQPVWVAMDGKVGDGVSFGDAAKSLDSENPKVLVEAVYSFDGQKEAVVLVTGSSDDRSATFLLPRLKDAGIDVRAAGFSLA